MKIHTEHDLHWYMDFFDQPAIFLVTEKMPGTNMMPQECVDEEGGCHQRKTSS